MHRVAVLALDGVYPFELGIPGRVFGSADGRYDVVTCGLAPGPVRTAEDFRVLVEHGPEALATADTVVIPPVAAHPAPGGCAPVDEVPGDWPMTPDGVSAPLAAALARIRPGTRIVSICTASFLLAAAGLLDGRRATTHWHVAPAFQRMFPRVRVDADVLFVDDGDVLTSAGAASGVDLCLHLIRRDHGSELANRAARACVVPPWRDGGQAQYIERPVPEPDATSTAATRAWALARLAEPLTLGDLAGHAGMSVRTFARRFQAEVGLSPGRWLTRQRVAHARHLLEASDLSIESVAREVGFATAASLRQHLHAAVGVAPVAYRRTFQHAEPA